MANNIFLDGGYLISIFIEGAIRLEKYNEGRIMEPTLMVLMRLRFSSGWFYYLLHTEFPSPKRVLMVLF